MQKNDYIEIEKKLVSYLIEIEQLQLKMKDLQTERIEWNQIDLLVSSLSGFICVLINESSNLSISRKTENTIGKFFSGYDMKNNPIDIVTKNIFNGDHRIHSQGHDLLRLFGTACRLMNGEAINYQKSGGTVIENIDEWDEITFEEAILIILVHFLKDAFTGRSLPIPGTSLIADINDEKVPKMLLDSYRSGNWNLKTLSGAIGGVKILEFVNQIFVKIAYSKENNYLQNQKRNELDLLSHTIVATYSAGKAFITSNPYDINYITVLKIIKNSCVSIDQKLIRTNNTLLKNEFQLAMLTLEQQVTILNSEIARIELDKSFLQVAKYKELSQTIFSNVVNERSNELFSAEIVKLKEDSANLKTQSTLAAQEIGSRGVFKRLISNSTKDLADNQVRIIQAFQNSEKLIQLNNQLIAALAYQQKITSQFIIETKESIEEQIKEITESQKDINDKLNHLTNDYVKTNKAVQEICTKLDALSKEMDNNSRIETNINERIIAIETTEKRNSSNLKRLAIICSTIMIFVIAALVYLFISKS